MLGKAVTVQHGARPQYGEYFGRSKPSIVAQRRDQRQLQASANHQSCRRDTCVARRRRSDPAHRARAAMETHVRRATYRNSIGCRRPGTLIARLVNGSPASVRCPVSLTKRLFPLVATVAVLTVASSVPAEAQ